MGTFRPRRITDTHRAYLAEARRKIPPEIGPDRGGKCIMVPLWIKIFPTGMPTWVNVYVAYRRLRKVEGRYSRVCLALKKYQRLSDGRWRGYHSYSVNHPAEATIAMAALKACFPEAL